MYVDKVLSGIKAVQTLSRLNRAHPKKHDVFVLDFMNDADTIEAAFADYYRTTILAEETDPNKLHDLKADARWLPGLRRGAGRRRSSSSTWAARTATGSTRSSTPAWRRTRSELDEDGQVDFKGKAKAFMRTYGFLASILPVHQRRVGEALDLPQLPRPQAAGARSRRTSSKGILEAIDMDSYRVEKQAAMQDPAPRRGRRDRAGADGRRRPQARARARPAVEHPQGLQRPVRQHPLDRRRPRPQAHHRGDPGAGGGRHGLPERAGRTPTSRTPASSTTRRSAA